VLSSWGWNVKRRETVVEHLHGPIFFELHVRRLEIAVDDTGFVPRFEGFRHLLRDRERFAEGDGTEGDPLRERWAFHELEHQSVLLEPVDRRDVRMVERRDEPRLTLEPRDPIRIGGELVGKDLDSHLAAELGIPSAVDLAHAALADGRDDLVRPEARSRGEWHRRNLVFPLPTINGRTARSSTEPWILEPGVELLGTA
jgi:hypothetical protein